MYQSIAHEQIQYLQKLKSLMELCVNEITIHAFWAQRQIIKETFIRFTIPDVFNSSRYFKEENYKFFQDRWNAKISIIEENDQFIFHIDYSGTAKEGLSHFYNTLKSDMIAFFTSTIKLVDEFYNQFEYPFSQDPSLEFVENFFHGMQYAERPFSFKMFIPHLQKIEAVGLVIDLDKVDNDQDDFFPLCLGDRIKFVPELEWKTEKYKHDHLFLANQIPYPEGAMWLYHAILKLRPENYFTFITNYAHILDFLLSEDIDAETIANLPKISLNDMLLRTRKWINKLAKEALIERMGDCQEIMSFGEMKVVQLLTPHALDRESAFLCHCIGRGSFDKVLQDVDRPLYSIRNKQNEPLATIEVHGMDVIQIQGFQNNIPCDSTRDIIKKFIERDHLSIRNPQDHQRYPHLISRMNRIV